MPLSLRRTVLRRSFIAIWVVLVLVISFHTLIQPPFRLSLKLRLFELRPEWAYPPEGEQALPPLGKHTLTSDGLLVANPHGPHPIFQLIHDAEAAWEAKRERASKTLQEAVAEYRQRYRRSPPLGFDKWWDYVVKHRVQLPDEYDEIFEDIEPFWGIDPHELARTQQELEQVNDVVTVQKTDANPQFEVVRSNLPSDRQQLRDGINNILAFVNEVEQDLPPMRMSISPFDNPEMFSSWQIKSMALEAAANGTTLTRADLPPITERGWIQGCPPDSPARLHPPILPPSSTPLPPSSPKTFIASHRDAMNPCMHPSLLATHGQFLRYKTGPYPKPTLVPRFSLCGTMLHHDIRPPVPYGWDFDSDPEPEENEEDGGGAFGEDLPWEHKANERLDWRGRTTGIYASPDSWWENGHRQRLVMLANSLEGNVSVLRAPESGMEYEVEATPVGEPERVQLAQINPSWMDVAFTDKPIACDQGTCDEMALKWPFLEMQGRREEGQYKFILDVDGNGWSGRFKRLITSNALIFKATIYPEWCAYILHLACWLYTSRIAPWVHYVPIQISYADLYDTVAFFREHDALARRIARAGRAWSRQYWRRADMTAYMYRLLLEYARVTSLDRESMDYIE
ncbi:hypothetical protein EV363DRAFT_1524658 [Boletus edulis]|nr:hypothetical protein EV363DRAFT_1524658 [Boletus edulis]